VANTKIEWAEKVWNPVVGCTKISPGGDTMTETAEIYTYSNDTTDALTCSRCGRTITVTQAFFCDGMCPTCWEKEGED
jgi:protein gp37